MINIDARDYTGYSEASLNDAIEDALQKADGHSYFEVIETRSSRYSDNKCQYHVTLTIYSA